MRPEVPPLDDDAVVDLGRSRGWEHANYVAAYGREHDRREPDYPGFLDWDIEQNARPDRKNWPSSSALEAARALFKKSWGEGRRFYAQGKYHDGTKIDNE